MLINKLGLYCQLDKIIIDYLKDNNIFKTIRNINEYLKIIMDINIIFLNL